eukprot:m.97007 g.97007  ORF g.97007 m.97007 type:complete len:114 (-) comp8979_c2_seq1:353-694(-)
MTSKLFRGVRMFLPEYNMALVRPSKPMEKTALFRVNLKMNKFEIKDYLQSIYGVPVESVNTKIVLGKTKVDRRSAKKKKRPDYKLAYVTLFEDFEFPDSMFPVTEDGQQQQQS